MAARWRELIAGLDAGTTLVVAADDPLTASLAEGHPTVVRYGIDDPSVALPVAPHAADARFCVRCGHPYDYRAAYVGHLSDYACPNCGNERAPLDVAARAIDLRGLDGTAFDLCRGSERVRVELALPGLYNVENALAAAALAVVLGEPLTVIAEGLGRFRGAFGRFQRLRVETADVVLLLIKNPAGANEVLRILPAGDTTMLFALNDRIADGRDVSWVWDVDWELDRAAAAPRRHLGHARRQTPRCGSSTRASTPTAIEVVPDVAQALDRLAELSAGGAGYVLPTYTAMLELQRIVGEPRARAPVLGGGGRVKLVLCQLYPEHLSIYADRGNVQVIRRRLEWRGLELEERPLRIGESLDPDAADLYLVGGGQDRDQLLVARGSAAPPRRAARRRGGRSAPCSPCAAATSWPVTATSGRTAARCRESACSTSRRAPATTRMIGDIVCECDLGDGAGPRTLVGFENHAGQTLLGAGCEPLARVVSGHGNDGSSGFEGARAGTVLGTYVHGPLLPKNPWLADWLIERALARRHGHGRARAARRRLELARRVQRRGVALTALSEQRLDDRARLGRA